MNQEQMKAAVKDHFQNKVMKANDYDNQVWDYVSDVPAVSCAPMPMPCERVTPEPRELRECDCEQRR